MSTATKPRTRKAVPSSKPTPTLASIPPYGNVAVSGRRVRAGDTLTFAVEGGYARKESPCDGLSLLLRNGDEIFVPASVLLGI